MGYRDVVSLVGKRGLTTRRPKRVAADEGENFDLNDLKDQLNGQYGRRPH
jgi:hypothetical protein